MKKCNKCGKNTVLYHRDFCRPCFQKIIEKRIRKYVRLNKMFSKNDNILVIGDLTEHLLKGILKDLPVNITKKNFASPFSKQVKDFAKKNKINKIVIPWTLDNEIEYFLDNWTHKKTTYDLFGEMKGYVKLFKPVMEEELEKFAKIKRIKFRAAKKNHLLDKIEKQYPGSKFGMANSIEEMKGIFKQ